MYCKKRSFGRSETNVSRSLRKDVGVAERLIGMIVDLETRFDSNAAHLHVADLDKEA